jgi:O-antigen/teichoic acid export membrane protein
MSTAGERPAPGLLGASGLMAATLVAVNLCNYGFHALSSRALGPEGYGALVAVLALVSILLILAQAVQTAMAHSAVIAAGPGAPGRLAALARSVLGWMAVLGAVFLAAAWLGGPALARFFRLEGPAPLLAAAAAVAVGLGLAVGRGVLQGQQRFGTLALNLTADAVLRLAAGAALLAFGAGVTGAVAAGAVSGVLAMLLAGWALAGLFRAPRGAVTGGELSGFVRYGFPVLAAAGAYAALFGTDVIVVKHFFPPAEAGQYAAASILGKALLFIPLAFAQVLFPKASAAHAAGQGSGALLANMLGLTAAALAAAALLVWALAPWLVLALFGARFAEGEALALVPGFCAVIAPFALVWVLTQYHLALERPAFGWLLLADLPVLVAALTLYHPSLAAVLWVLGLDFLALLAAGILFTWRCARGARSLAA